jgi:flagellar basal body rod protein FlgG
MDSLSTAAAAGMRARMQSLEMLANNIANQAASGFKMDREFYGTYESSDADAFAGLPFSTPVVEQSWTDFSQGALVATGNALNIGIEGKGFLTVAGPGEKLYTRGGNLRLSASGVLQTQNGYGVLNSRGEPIQLDSAQPIEILEGGEIHQGGAEVARIGIVDFASAGALTKQTGTYFRLADPSATPTPATSATLRQGMLENSNSSPSEAAIRLVGVMRQFEILQKAIQIGSEMGKRGEEVARIGS